MKKAIAIILALILAGGSFVYIRAAGIIDEADEVSYTQTVLLGDPKYADGLNVRFTAEQNNSNFDSFIMPLPRERYVWTSDMAFKNGQVESTEASLIFTSEKDGLDMPLSIKITEEYVIPSDIEDGLREKYADKIAKGEPYKVSIWAGSIFDFVPIAGYIYRESKNTEVPERYYNGALTAKLKEYFRFPVPEDVYLNLTVTDKHVFSIRYTYGEQDEYSTNGQAWNCGSIEYGGCLYFYVNCIDITGGYDTRLASYSMVPGGYGLYRLDMSRENGDLKIDAESLCTFLSLDADQVIVGLAGSDKGAVINVFVMETESKGYAVYSVDAKSGEILSTEKISTQGDPRFKYIRDGEGCALLASGDAFIHKTEQKIYCLVEDGEGILRRALTADIDKLTDNDMVKSLFLNKYEYSGPFNSMPCAFKDGRLYLVETSFTAKKGQNGESLISTKCGICLAVFDETGPLYFGTYDSSLGAGRVFGSEYHPPVLWFE